LVDLIIERHVLVLEVTFGRGFAEVRFLFVSSGEGGAGGLNDRGRVGHHGSVGVTRLELHQKSERGQRSILLDGRGRGRVRRDGKRRSMLLVRRVESRLMAVASIVCHDGVSLRRGLHSLFHRAVHHTAAVVLTGSAGTLHRLLTILAPVVAIFILIHLSSTFNHKTLLRSQIGRVSCRERSAMGADLK
jgi:hypothetical protein